MSDQQTIVLTTTSPAAIVHMLTRRVELEMKPHKDGSVTVHVAAEDRGVKRFYERSAN